VVEPYPVLNLAGSLTNINAGEIEISQSGPISSSLWTYPLLSMDANEPGQGDEGDVRMFGMDYGWYDPSYGDFFIPAINTYGTWHTPQPYFAEFDLYMDVDGDGFTDFIDWNSEGSVVYQYEVATGFVYLASPYLLYSDFNTGFMEWYLPAAWHSLGGSDTDMDYLLYGFDYHGNADMGAMGSFDYARPPFMWSISGDPGPDDPTAWVNFELYDAGGYALSQPLGLMVVDYLGKGGSGQAYAYEFNLETPFRLNMPVIGK